MALAQSRIHDDSVGGVDTSDVCVFEVAYVVIAHEVEARRLFALRRGGREGGGHTHSLAHPSGNRYPPSLAGRDRVTWVG